MACHSQTLTKRQKEKNTHPQKCIENLRSTHLVPWRGFSPPLLPPRQHAPDVCRLSLTKKKTKLSIPKFKRGILPSRALSRFIFNV